MPDAATVNTNGTFGIITAGLTEDQVIATAGTIMYGFAYHVTVAGANLNHNHNIQLVDNNDTILLQTTVSSNNNSAGGRFVVPALVEGLKIRFTATAQSNSPAIEYVVWTDGSHVRATEQQ